MESPRASGLIPLLLRYALTCFCGACAILIAWGTLFFFLTGSSTILPANTAELAAQQAAAHMEESGTFSREAVPALCGFARFDQAGVLQETSLTGAALRDAMFYRESGVNRNGRYHIEAQLADGVCVLQYRIRAEYANAALRWLPSAELLLLAVLFCSLALMFGGLTGRVVRRLRRGLAPLSAAAAQLAENRLDAPLPSSDIAEYNEVLTSMRHLQSSLRSSLETQWDMEHSRVAQMNALAHDLRTPLTVIDGNAQLLRETALDEEQTACADAILRNCEHAQSYVARLREAARGENASAVKTETRADLLCAQLVQEAKEVCLAHGALLEFLPIETSGQLLFLAQEDVRRAAVNLVQNAAERTPQGGAVRCQGTLTSGHLLFCVTDEGPGFSPAALRHAAEPFFTENAGRTPSAHMGMGLAFTAAVARGHAGTLQLSNTPEGHGCAALALCVERPAPIGGPKGV